MNGLTSVFKLLLCGLAFIAGMMVGSLLSVSFGLVSPPMPEQLDQNTAFMSLALTSPIIAVALALVARGLPGGRLPRALILSFLLWVTYTVNTVIEASIFTTYAAASLFTLVAFLPAALFCGAATAFLFPPANAQPGLLDTLRSFWRRRTTGAWAWRLALAAVAFAPIYLAFGLCVAPFTAEYYRQSMLGLVLPSPSIMFAVLLVRSVLFLLASLPVVSAWNGSPRGLAVTLGLALFVFVGLVYMLQATWLPPIVRIPHSLEIMADSLTYSAVLTLLLGTRSGAAPKPAAHAFEQA